MKYKFKVGDKVEVVMNGYGCDLLELGTISTITELGFYAGDPGYRVDNLKNEGFDDFIGEDSFKLYSTAVAESGHQNPTEAVEMTEKRKVRKDFDPKREYSVDVSGCTEDEKKKVQQAFFDVGFVWELVGKEYAHLDAVQYSNTTGGGYITTLCMYGTTTEGCNMSPDEFFSYVYEPEQQGHPHSDLLMKYAEISKTDPEPYKHFEYYSESLSKWIQLKSEDSLFSADYKYRLRPQVKIIHGVEVPDIGIDLSEETERTDFYTPCTFYNKLFIHLSHHPIHADCSQLSTLGLAYPYTEEGKQAAILHAKAMLGIDPYN